MNEKEFTLWLKGFMDSFTSDTLPTKEQFQMIKEKLNGIIPSNIIPSYPIGTPNPYGPPWTVTSTHSDFTYTGADTRGESGDSKELIKG